MLDIDVNFLIITFNLELNAFGSFNRLGNRRLNDSIDFVIV